MDKTYTQSSASPLPFRHGRRMVGAPRRWLWMAVASTIVFVLVVAVVVWAAAFDRCRRRQRRHRCYGLLAPNHVPPLWRWWRTDDDHSSSSSGCWLEVVIARYNESLAWLDDAHLQTLLSAAAARVRRTRGGGGDAKGAAPLIRYRVYNKGADTETAVAVGSGVTTATRISSLPNVGRCDHTYLHHVITEYDCGLAPVTLFVPASVPDSYKWGKLCHILRHLRRHPWDSCLVGSPVDPGDMEGFFLDEWRASNPENNQVNPETTLLPASPRPFGPWFRAQFGGEAAAWPRIVSYGGILAVSRHDIRQHPVDGWYRSLRDQVATHSNPEAGHYIERSWETIFGPFRRPEVSRCYGVDDDSAHCPDEAEA